MSKLDNRFVDQYLKEQLLQTHLKENIPACKLIRYTAPEEAEGDYPKVDLS